MGMAPQKAGHAVLRQARRRGRAGRPPGRAGERPVSGGPPIDGGIRLPPPTGRARGRPQETASVQFGEEEVRRIQALTVIFKTTPNAVIREACSFYLSHETGTPGWHEASEACRRRASEVAGTLEQDQQTR